MFGFSWVIMLTVSGSWGLLPFNLQNPAPPKKPWNDESLQIPTSINKPWVFWGGGSQWCEILWDFVHPPYLGILGLRVPEPQACELPSPSKMGLGANPMEFSLWQVVFPSHGGKTGPDHWTSGTPSPGSCELRAEGRAPRAGWCCAETRPQARSGR